jgi:hypothetical protein
MRLKATLRTERRNTSIAAMVPFVARLRPAPVICAVDPVDPKTDN